MHRLHSRLCDCPRPSLPRVVLDTRVAVVARTIGRG